MTLTPQQFKISLLISQGHSAKEISLLLGCSPQNIWNHLQDIYIRLGIRNGSTTKLALFVRDHPSQFPSNQSQPISTITSKDN